MDTSPSVDACYNLGLTGYILRGPGQWEDAAVDRKSA